MKKFFIFCFFVNFISAKSVICSFEILENICSQLCKETDIKVESIVPKGSDPHLFQPKPSDSKKIAAAEIVIVNGLNLEGWIENLIKSSGYKGKLIKASEGINARTINKIPDPHIWHDPLLVIEMLKNIKDSLISKFPQHSKIINKNYLKTVESFHNLHTELKNIFHKISEIKRKIVTTHDAFFYFARRYEIIVFSPQGINTGEDPSALEVSKLIKTIKSENINAIFLEKMANQKIMKTISKETGKNFAGTLFADNLIKNKSLQETILENAKNIAKAM